VGLDLFKTGTYLRKPGGNVENVNEQKAAGMAWEALNIGGDVGNDPTVWGHQRNICRQQGMPVGPWMHVRSIADLEFLLGVAESWNADFIGPNVEDLVGDHLSLQQIGGYLLDFWVNKYEKPVHMATLPWVQNGQGWQYVAFCYLALEMFPLENPVYLQQYEACIEHAFNEGAKKVTLLYSTTSPRSMYPAAIAHCCYTADNVNNWAEWKDTVPQVPPKPQEVPVPPKPPIEKEWYQKPYLTGSPVGPEKLPRALYPPSGGKGTFTGDDVTAFKRGISRAGRLVPWSPATWSNGYGETFAMGDGSGNVGKSGVRGFQRQQFPNDKSMHTGNMGDKTYQAMRRALISDPNSPHFREPLFDPTARVLLKRAAEEAFEDAKIISFRKHLAEFCERAEGASSSSWTYSQQRPYTGLGVEPEKYHVNDCSSYVILAYWWGRTKSGLAVPDPSDYQYDGYGNTGDDLDGHPVVTSGNYLVGDLAHYGSGSRGHVTICRKRGDKTSSVWSSFGSEPKPNNRELFYRSDFRYVVRPPLGIEDL
jgi:hypothetical protein